MSAICTDAVLAVESMRLTTWRAWFLTLSRPPSGKHRPGNGRASAPRLQTRQLGASGDREKKAAA
eukprot:4175023-Lingulodinium_polyedra.AAC.1